MYITSTEESIDGFVDDIITISVDCKHWIDRTKIAALLVIHRLFRPFHPSEPLKRHYPLYFRKLAGEGQLAEHKKYLGWHIRTHSMRVLLPEEKKIVWTTDIK